MFLIHWLRFLKGSVHFEASGPFLERFLNLAAREGIPIWNGKFENGVFSGETIASSYKRFHSLSHKTHISLKITKRKGLPFYRIRYRKRMGAVMGVGILILSILLSGQFVWKVEVHGNKRIPTNQIVEAAKEHGVRAGAYKKGIDVIAVGERLSVEFEEVSWATVNLIGTVAHIEIIERVMPPEMLHDDSPCNVVAERAGQIESIEVYEGEKMVKAGDTVQKGDILASGILEDKKGRSHLKHARAKAILSFSEEKKIEIPLKQTEYVVEGKHQNYYSLHLGKVQIPLSLTPSPKGEVLPRDADSSDQFDILQNENGTWTRWEKERKFYVLDKQLPFSLMIRQYTPISQKTFQFTPEIAKRRALQKAAVLERQMKEEGITIHNRSLRGNVEGEKYCLNAVYQCTQESSKEEPILIENHEVEK